MARETRGNTKKEWNRDVWNEEKDGECNCTKYNNIFWDHHVKDTIINMVKLIKQENWEKLMQNSDSLFEWLDLNRNIRDVFENVKKDV